MARSNVGTVRRLSHHQLSTDGLHSAGHRLDLLIAEQRTLVKSAQESLQQALAKYETSKPKEQESAKVQVQSLLTRAQDLVITVQVILHIRSEIGHIQQEIKNAKARHEPTIKLYGRLQWLEQHLEKILMARRRGRPGVHIGRRRQLQAPARDARRRLAEPSQRETVSVGTTSRGDNLSDFEDLSTPWKSGTTEESNARRVQSRSLFSSKQSASHDSDVWHSESEANWTMVETFSNQPKDITQSQVLSEDEPKPSRSTFTASWPVGTENSVSQLAPCGIVPEESESAHSPGGSVSNEGYLPISLSNSHSKCASRLQGTGGYKFESRRPVEVFGDCSWNSLSLAVNTNLVESVSKMTSDLLGISMSMLHAGVSDINKDIESLKKLITNAGQAATSPGPLVSANKAAVHFILSSRERSACRRAGRLEGSRSPAGQGLPSLDGIECSKISPSRKVYGKQVIHNRSSTFPRVTDTWCKNSFLDAEDTTRLLLTSSESVPSVRFSSRIRRPRTSRGISRESHLTDKDDEMFEREKYQENHIKHLIAQTESPITDTRKTSVQTLGLLPNGGEAVEKRLYEIMVSDKTPLIQYESLKSLISLGVINDDVIAFVSYCLRGSHVHVLCTDLLLFLSQEHIIPHLSKERDDACPSAIESLRPNLVGLLQTDDFQLSFHAAILLSRVGLEREKCIEVLKKALNTSRPELQSQALKCLVRFCQCSDSIVICSALQQIKSFHNWKFRKQTAENLMLIDKKDLILATDETGKSVFDVLVERLPNEPVLGVRLTIGKLLTHLGLSSKAEKVLVGRLESKSEVTRAEAVKALSGLEIQSPKHIHTLVECLDVDPSTYVRVQVVKLFGNMKRHSSVILNQLIEKSKGRGPVAKECVAVLQGMSKT